MTDLEKLKSLKNTLENLIDFEVHMVKVLKIDFRDSIKNNQTELYKVTKLLESLTEGK